MQLTQHVNTVNWEPTG